MTIPQTQNPRHTSASLGLHPKCAVRNGICVGCLNILDVSETDGIRVQHTDNKNFTDVGLYRHDETSDTPHSKSGHTPGLHVFVPTREPAHASDPPHNTNTNTRHPKTQNPTNHQPPTDAT
ncbi:MAG: hypothetical protein KTU85_04100 [Acidimicrobiia bacterium]|nr:hypothetical protein [Acidimicrobiia bacterium]